MTPKEKAKELVKKMDIIHYMKFGRKNPESKGLPISMYNSQVYKCAIVACDEMIYILKYFNNENAFRDDMTLCYWQKVKNEISSLSDR